MKRISLVLFVGFVFTFDLMSGAVVRRNASIDAAGNATVTW